MEAKYGGRYYLLVGLLTVITFGVGILIVLWMRTMWIASADPTGVTTQSGRRFEWSDLTGVEGLSLTAVGARVAGVTTLLYGSKRVIINSAVQTNARELLGYINPHLPR